MPALHDTRLVVHCQSLVPSSAKIHSRPDQQPGMPNLGNPPQVGGIIGGALIKVGIQTRGHRVTDSDSGNHTLASNRGDYQATQDRPAHLSPKEHALNGSRSSLAGKFHARMLWVRPLQHHAVASIPNGADAAPRNPGRTPGVFTLRSSTQSQKSRRARKTVNQRKAPYDPQ